VCFERGGRRNHIRGLGHEGFDIGEGRHVLEDSAFDGTGLIWGML
jgi:hypothetical protein